MNYKDNDKSIIDIFNLFINGLNKIGHSGDIELLLPYKTRRIIIDSIIETMGTYYTNPVDGCSEFLLLGIKISRTRKESLEILKEEEEILIKKLFEIKKQIEELKWKQH